MNWCQVYGLLILLTRLLSTTGSGCAEVGLWFMSAQKIARSRNRHPWKTSQLAFYLRDTTDGCTVEAIHCRYGKSILSSRIFWKFTCLSTYKKHEYMSARTHINLHCTDLALPWKSSRQHCLSRFQVCC